MRFVRIVELTNAGHYPLEEPGLSELTEAVAALHTVDQHIDQRFATARLPLTA